MVTVALDESPGTLEFEVSMAKQQARIKFQPSKIDEEALMKNITKRTGYTNMTIKN